MVIIKTAEQVEGIRKSCKLLAKVMEELVKAAQPGVTPKELNEIAEEMIVTNGGLPAFKGYRAGPATTPFPTGLCASLNDIVVHGPATSEIALKDGDILGMDLGIDLNGYFSDMAKTVTIGQVDQKIQKLVDVTRESLSNGIKQMAPGVKIRQISQAIEDTIRPHGFGIVREFVGHGVGIEVHEDPRIPNYVSESMRDDLEIELEPGMVLAIEPMLTAGSEDVDILNDGWSVKTRDKSLAAHFEHTVLVTDSGHEILTKL